ncbi:LacI family DNA-binding transcriptional regulator [Priestia taiwanensis]|uniref:LacI family transcriptional regulator n=1 Tax=Priestia taiwanensis TaxID=1347902 RepID=A0A917AZ05_9BACI|nr:LacI family DNA-binding transcriptional regulator [Priestia taiwanensis]MBM7365016.1 DNA-binding LacI/PurR family transcriptional regulator [Priestia taiwanensis]GGE83386.1 LacI family transcriptional regulator [Priestia taiwanensis]
MTTIRQIAKLANVSVSTVSRVLNNHPYVNEQTRNDVQAIIDQLNYTPNSNAIHLSKGKTNVIGISLPLVNNQYYSSILEGIAKEAAKENYHLMVCQTNNDKKKEEEILQMLRNKKMDGLIMCSKLNEGSSLEMFSTYAPIVTCEANDVPSISSVYMNHYETFRMSMDYLIQKGHTKIGYCIGRKNSFNSTHRKQAYIEGLHSIGVTPNTNWTFEECLTIDDGKHVAQQLVQLDQRPTALVVSCNHIAASIRKEIERNGIQVPEQLAIIGCDDQPIGDLFDITTISSQSEQLGKHAFRLFFKRLTTEQQLNEHIEVSPQLIERTST